MAPRKKPLTGRKKQNQSKHKPWQPDSKQLEWHRLWTEEFKTFAQIAAQSKPVVTREAIYKSVHKTEEWIRVQNYDSIMRFKGRQTTTLERIVGHALHQFLVGKRKVLTVESGNTAGEHGGPWDKRSVRYEKLDTAAFLAEARAAMSDIRKIWGAEAPVKSSVDVLNSNEIEGLPGMAGFASHEEFLRATAAAIENMANMTSSAE